MGKMGAARVSVWRPRRWRAIISRMGIIVQCAVCRRVLSPGEEHTVPSQLDLSWNADPLVVLAILALGAGYYAAVGPLRARHGWGTPATGRQIACYASGIILLAITLITPLDTLGRTTSFAAHMLQLMLLSTAVGPLLLLGLPEWLVRATVRPFARLGPDAALLAPLVIGFLFNGVFIIWHVTPIYEAGLHNELLHDLESLTILLTGALNWWPLLSPHERRLRLANWGQIVYLLLESLPLDIFAVFLLFSGAPFYPTYIAAAQRLGFSAMIDQQVAAGIYLAPETFIDLIFMSLAFFGWIQRIEHEQEEKERLADLRAAAGQHDDVSLGGPSVEPGTVA
jgi:putative membrane protein